MDSSESVPVGISQAVRIDGKEVYSGSWFPSEAQYAKPQDTTSSYSYLYSGRHDHGMLPALKVEGDMAVFLTALQNARKEAGAALTALLVDPGSTTEELDVFELPGDHGGEDSSDEEVSEKKATPPEKKQKL